MFGHFHKYFVEVINNTYTNIQGSLLTVAFTSRVRRETLVKRVLLRSVTDTLAVEGLEELILPKKSLFRCSSSIEGEIDLIGFRVHFIRSMLWYLNNMYLPFSEPFHLVV